MILSNSRCSALRHLARGLSVALLVSLVSVTAAVMARPAAAVGINLTPIGGSARGAVGEILSVGIDLVIEEGEFVTSAAPVLQWDLEGGNVLDAIRGEEMGILAGGIPLNPVLSDRWRILNPTLIDEDGRGDFGDGIRNTLDLNDQRPGATAVWGFEAVTASFSSEEALLEVYSSGVSAAGTYRIGVIDFLLREVGSTTISFLTDERFVFRSFFSGNEFEMLPNNTIELTSLDVNSTGFEALQIFVVPEPGTGILLGVGLSILSTLGRRQVW